MRPCTALRAPAGAAAAAALGLCSLLLLLRPGHACPAGCACTDPHTVDCRDRGLPSVPDPFPLDVRKLLVAGNRIQRIPEDFFIFYGDLVYLDFRNNSLRSLEEGTFSGSAKLAFLDLSYNNLTQLGAGAFRSAGRLVRLSLGNNRLAGVHEAAFETLESLQVLELNDNDLRGLSVAALAALPALRTLRLDGNPWLCDCDFAHLFTWIQENPSKLPGGEQCGWAGGWAGGARAGGGGEATAAQEPGDSDGSWKRSRCSRAPALADRGSPVYPAHDPSPPKLFLGLRWGGGAGRDTPGFSRVSGSRCCTLPPVSPTTHFPKLRIGHFFSDTRDRNHLVGLCVLVLVGGGYRTTLCKWNSPSHVGKSSASFSLP